MQTNRFISENYDKLKQTVISHDTEEYAVISPLVIPPEIEQIVLQKLDVKDPCNYILQLISLNR